MLLITDIFVFLTFFCLIDLPPPNICCPGLQPVQPPPPPKSANATPGKICTKIVSLGFLGTFIILIMFNDLLCYFL